MAGNLQKLQKKRTGLRSSIMQLLENLETVLAGPVIDKNVIEEYLNQLASKESYLLELNRDIDSLNKNLDEVEREVLETQDFSDKIIIWKTRANRALKLEDSDRDSRSSSSSVQHQNSVKLPKLNLECFSGDAVRWQGFWSQYDSAIHQNRNLTAAEKFGYLKSYLKGPAASAIAGLMQTDQNYDAAIKILRERFGRRDLVINAHMNRLLNLKPVKRSSDLKDLRELYDLCETQVRSLESMGVTSGTYGSLLCPILLRMVPDDISLEFSRKHDSDVDWNVEELLNFLRKEVECRERASLLAKLKPEHSNEPQSGGSGKRKDGPHHGKTHGIPSASALNATAEASSCPFCDKTDHVADSCKLTVEERRAFLKERGRCFVCLRYKHLARFCKARYKTCSRCGKRHNVAVCLDDSTTKEERVNDSSKDTVVSAVTPTRCSSSVMLQTLQVVVEGTGSKNKMIRCLLDGGSQRTFVTERVSRELSLPVVGEETLNIFTFGNDKPDTVTRRKVKFIVRNILKPDSCIELEALETPNISSAMITIPDNGLAKTLEKTGIQHSDMQTNTCPTNHQISLLIGSDYYWRVMTGRYERVGDSIMALEGILGWTLQGPSNVSSVTVEGVPVVMNKVMTENIVSNQLRAFWEIESLGITEKQISENDDDALRHFKSTVSYQNGRYEVSFPWKLEHPDLPDNYELARSRLNGLLKRLKRDATLFDKYDAEIRQQISEGIVEEVKGNLTLTASNENPVHYIPHHAVLREDKSTKLRIVFDASAHVAGKPSLNDCLLTGPNLNPDLLSVLVKFRTHKIGLIADVKKAFLQISLTERDRDVVRFLWFDGPPDGVNDTKIKILRMTRVVFGVASSPFLLSVTVRHHLDKYKNLYPATCELLNECLYMDDFISGSDDEVGALKLRDEATKILAEAGMDLTKWESNSTALYRTIPNEAGAAEIRNIAHNPDATPFKVLGLSWQRKTDEFVFDLRELISFLIGKGNTKRCILQAAARIFDPIGFLSPFVIRIKCMFQSLWELGLEWDAELPPALTSKWRNWCQELPFIKEISVPRYYFLEAQGEKFEPELHIFTDASELAYGAVVYIRYTTATGEVGTSFVCSKSRVAPLKRLTLPRLELLGAIVGVRLNKFVQGVLKVVDKVFLWSDSTITLHWIKGDSRRWKPFVQNRVIEVQTETNPENWFHCPTKENPADFLTRGQSVQSLQNNQLWWSGPKWLKYPKSEWPDQKIGDLVVQNDSRDEERTNYKETLQASCATEISKQDTLNVENYSSVSRLIRVTAWIRRFIQNCRPLPEKLTGPLSTQEILDAEMHCIKTVQAESFEEMHILKAKKKIPENSKIFSLNPYLDENGLMCVKGRLQKSYLEEREKHPWILPYKHRFSELIMKSTHENLMHSGMRYTLVQVREKFWVVNGRKLVKMVINKCLVCKRLNAKPGTETMAPLPRDRITEAPPFNTTGLDYAGPLYVKNDGRTEKAYILLFTCAITRAVHLELVHDLSTFTFLLAFRRFVARRGICHKLYSDNSKTFKKADKDLQMFWSKLKTEELQNYFGQNGIQWNFITDRAPWWGGMWERLVRSVKTCLKKTLGKTSLTFEEMRTTLTEVEAILNSRPLTYVYSEIREPSPLTPAHFLIGQRITTLPSGINSDQNKAVSSSRKALTKRLKYRELILTQFWNRWRKEYLLELRSAIQSPGYQSTGSFKPGDIVLIQEEKIPRQMWKMGRIEEVFHGRDQRIRSCSIRLASETILKRPIQLIYNLELV